MLAHHWANHHDYCDDAKHGEDNNFRIHAIIAFCGGIEGGVRCEIGHIGDVWGMVCRLRLVLAWELTKETQYEVTYSRLVLNLSDVPISEFHNNILILK